MWIHSEFKDKKDQVWHFQFYQIMFYHQSWLYIRQSQGNFVSAAELSTPTQVSSLCDPAEVIMWIQLISINKLLIWVMTCLQRSRLSVWARGEHCVPKKTLCLLKHSRFYWSAQVIYVMFVGAETHLQNGRQGLGLKKKTRLVKHNFVL